MQFTEQSMKRNASELVDARDAKVLRAEAMDSPRPKATFDDEDSTEFSYGEEEVHSCRVSFVGEFSEAADPLWTSRRSLTPAPAEFVSIEDLAGLIEDEQLDMPPKVSPENRLSVESSDEFISGENTECPTNLPTHMFTDCLQSPEHPHTLFSPEPATEVPAATGPWGAAEANTFDVETALSHDADFAYLASTLAAWSPASPLPEDPKTIQQEA